MKWYTCILNVKNHVTPIQWFHTRAENPDEAAKHAAKWMSDGGTFGLTLNEFDVSLVFEGKLEPVRTDEGI